MEQVGIGQGQLLTLAREKDGRMGCGMVVALSLQTKKKQNMANMHSYFKWHSGYNYRPWCQS